MAVKTIKDVDPRTWSEIKLLSHKHRLKMGKMLHLLVENYHQNSNNFWEKILHHPVLISKEEERELLLSVKNLRGGPGFRE